MRNVLLVVSIIALAGAAQAAPGDVVIREWDFARGDAGGWAPTNNLKPFGLAGGALATQATGGDANLSAGGLGIATAEVTHLVFRMKSDSGGSTQVYFATDESPNMGANAVPAVHCPGDNSWHEYTVKLFGLKGFGGKLTTLRLDPVNGGGESARIEIAWVRLIRMAPRILPERFSCSEVLLPPGEKATVRLKLANLGGPLSGKLDATLAVPAGVSVAESRAAVEMRDDGTRGEATWTITGGRPGLFRVAAVVESGDKTLLRCAMLVPVGSLSASAAGRAVTLDSGGLSLLFPLDDEGACGMAYVRVRAGKDWKPVGVLSPLAQFVTEYQGAPLAEDVTFTTVRREGDALVLGGHEGAALVRVRFAPVKGKQQVAVSSSLSMHREMPVHRFAGPLLRVGLGPEGNRKQGALFPGHEFLEGDEPSSNIAVVGKLRSYRPCPDPKSVTVPALAVQRDDVVAGMMWDPLQEWGGPDDAMPVAEFASPNFLDDQRTHLVGCFVPHTPGRDDGQPVAGAPVMLPLGRGLGIETRLFALPGGDLTDVAPLWYRTYGMPKIPPAVCTDRQAFDLLMQGYGKTLWDPEKRGFTTHYQHGETPRWVPSFAAKLLVHAGQTGERRWTEAVGVKPDATLMDVVGSMLKDPRIPGPPKEIETQLPGGLWAYEEKTSHKVFEFSDGFSDRLGEPGETYIGHSAGPAGRILAHAVAWGDEKSIAAGLKALKAMERYRVPRGAQTWEVPAGTPDLYGAAIIADCFRMGYQLTGDKSYLEQCRYWLYSGLPFLYAYRVPGTGPGVKALVSGKGDAPGSVYHRDPDAHEVTPWGSIPVFGTSLYKVSWFGTLVHFCGLVWARSVYDTLEIAEDPLLKAAADGVTRVGVNMTTDVEPYVGLLPDSWSVAGNRAQPALIGPMRVEPPLRAVLDLPDYGGAHRTVVRGGGTRVHLHSRGVVSDGSLQGGKLRWRQRYLPGQVCETLVVRGSVPRRVTAGGRELPRVDDILAVEEGWQAFPAAQGFGIRVKQRAEHEAVEVTR